MKILILSLLSTFCFAFSFSQPGIISGTILDKATGETLVGATVLIVGTSQGTATDLDGKYQLKVAPGVYTMVISYIGYNEKRITDITVTSKEVTYLDVTLSDEAVNLEVDIVVTAKSVMRSENALLLLQKKSEKIQDGISAQEMNRLNVGDAAAAMKKVNGASVKDGKYIYIRGLGDRYSLSQLNDLIIPSTDPYRNGAQLDLIPSNLLDNIIATKTFTPDQPGTFTGGSVNIKTKSFPEQFSLSVSLSSSFNGQNNFIDNFLTHAGGDHDYLGYDDGTRARPAFLDDELVKPWLNKNGALIPRLGRADSEEVANYVDRAAHALNSDFLPVEKNTMLNHGIAISLGNQYNVFGNALGLIFSASYKHDYRHLDRFQKANWKLEDLSTGVLKNQGDYEDTQSTENPVVNGLFGIAYRLGQNHSVSFNALYNHNTDKTTRYLYGEQPDNIVYPDFLQGRGLMFLEREMINYQLGGEHAFPKWNEVKIDWKISRTESSMGEPDSRFFTNQLNLETQRYSLPQSNIDRPFHFFRSLTDEQQDAKLDVTIPVSENKVNKIKIGGLYSKKDRNFEEFKYQIDQDRGVGFTGNVTTYLADENMGIVDQDDRGRFYIGNYVSNRTSPDNSYSGYDEVKALYGMITLEFFKRLKFVGGARYEKSNLFVESAAESRPAEERIGKIDDADWLPSLNFIYPLKEDMNLRASYSQTIAKPNLREMAPFIAFDPLTTEFFLGNTQLRKTDINNYDLRWEWFINTGEIIAVSGYYKEFTNPISLLYRKSSNPEIQYTNVKGGNLIGVEFEVRKSLTPLGNLFDNFHFGTNVSIIRSSLDVVDLTGLEPKDRPFEGQPPLILNTILNYSHPEKNVDATLSLNFLGDRLHIIGRAGTPDIYERGRADMDFTFIKRFGDLQLKLNVDNILNSPYTISSDYKGTEYVYSLFRTGLTYGMSVTYTVR